MFFYRSSEFGNAGKSSKGKAAAKGVSAGLTGGAGKRKKKRASYLIEYEENFDDRRVVPKCE